MYRLKNAGADLVRVGIGSGAVCTTRLVAGVGYPQLSAVIECADGGTNFHGEQLENNIVCDGGCYHPGDFAKAFVAGARMIMAGSVFAGHKEGGISPSSDGKVHFRGNAAMPEPAPDGNTYRSSEGRVVEIPYKGSINDTINYILGGVRSACSYVGARNLTELRENAQFIRCGETINRVIEHYTVG